MKIISALLILVTAFLSLKHGWEGLRIDSHPEQAKMLTDLGLNRTAAMVTGVLSLLIGVAILFPQTFFAANLLNAITIVVIMALSLRMGNYRIALMEIPFLIIPLLLIYLGNPLKK